ncbi:OLC1v1036066C1 [Oldenlandia corymbosa var. corymbosa]|uniref:OLC1v1036066C1 n=1 Tax=Oldenlandia corymbosa var. corymbosa TaxID=529605 RepID=A0AAV1CVJ6_OLDCO|nr:OLC1v1036066C1 [Oldenlandia corymbosa var. corymbosa]
MINIICWEFLWGVKESGRSMSLVGWEELCQKKDEGGLGIRDAKLWNMAGIIKQVWHIAVKDSLDQVRDEFDGNRWKHSVNGRYSIKSSYQWLKGGRWKLKETQCIWSSINISKHSSIASLAWKKRLLTRDRLAAMNLLVPDLNCLLCKQVNESVQHLFFECQFAKQMIGQLVDWLGRKRLAENETRWRRTLVDAKKIFDMLGDVKKRKTQELSNRSQNEEDNDKPCSKRPKLKPNSGLKRIGSGLKKKKRVDRPDDGKGNALKGKSLLQRAKALLHKKSFKKQANSSSQKDTSGTGTKRSKDGGKHGTVDMGLQKVKKRRKRKRKSNAVLDEAARLQRRTRYLLIKVKLEQNLIDAYCTEGWKGQSREKIKPDKELERATKQILNCKLGIREAIRQLDLLSSAGRIDDSAVAPDGSVHHEHIICAACKLREAFPDNDIILCDGTCNRAFHQKCLDPPLSTENIPPGDEGWFCRYCKSKMEILEATNAHLGTNFAVDSNWQDIFKEEANLNDGKESMLCQEQDWPSDDSEDVDYDPESKEYSCTNSMTGNESDSSGSGSSSCSLRSLQDDILFLSEKLDNSIRGSEDKSTEIDSDGTDCDILCGPRTRKAVDYIKLHDELFGKNAPFSEQISEDEDWGPSRRKRRGKEPCGECTNVTVEEKQGNFTEEKSTEVKRKRSANKSIIVASSENECNSAEERSPEAKRTGKSKRPIFRFPRNVVEKLRIVFAENELPSRTIRENLSKQLGLDAEKVNKWFKNSRYLALKARKKEKTHHASSPTESNQSEDGVENNPADAMASRDKAVLHVLENSRDLKTSSHRSTACLVARNFKRKRRQIGLPLSPIIKKVPVDFGDDVSLKHLREKVKKKKKLNLKRSSAQKEVKEAEDELERLCKIKDKIEKLQEILLSLPIRRPNKVDAAALNEFAVSYVPIAELREKR